MSPRCLAKRLRSHGSWHRTSRTWGTTWSCSTPRRGDPMCLPRRIGHRGSCSPPTSTPYRRIRLRESRLGSWTAAAAAAIDALVDVLVDVRHATWPNDPMFGETTVNIGVIAGGTRPNVVAAEARADLQIRLVTEVAPVQTLLERAVRDRARIDYLTAVPPLRLATVPGFESCVVRFTTDIPHLTNWGTPLLLGPGSILDAHSAHERISESELAAGVDSYVRLVHALAVRKAEA